MNFTKISRPLLQKIKFSVMTDSDKNGFAGVQSPVPLIGEIEDEGICVIIDGNYAELYAFDGNGSFELIDQNFDIMALPYEIDAELCVATAGDEDSFSNLGV